MRFLPIIMLAVIISLASCGGIEKGERIRAREEAAMMEGRNAARLFLHRDTTDTTGLYNEIREAKTERDRYLKNGLKSCGDAFDSGFARTIRAVNPALSVILDH